MTSDRAREAEREELSVARKGRSPPKLALSPPRGRRPLQFVPVRHRQLQVVHRGPQTARRNVLLHQPLHTSNVACHHLMSRTITRDTLFVVCEEASLALVVVTGAPWRFQAGRHPRIGGRAHRL